ncbi:pantothenate kinase [Limimonas halophila]|uniref:Type III pantothenate kinase n=1 Tax=Limimonas halophila TaxID=1082479 RepID=A0A1G7N829_9PROT|nr:type III pantothenate kinase [Limimonas halophila]SDF70101.1 pantothenate kinase [Limimonas halophila]
MLLAIDCGNTNIVFAVHDGTDWRASWRAATHAERTADEYAVWLTELMALNGLGPHDIDGTVVATVVPAVSRELRRLCRVYFGGEPLVVGDPDVRTGVPVRVDRPDQLGADRLANAVAGHARYGGPLIVVDFGTATTFDMVGADGGYEGGVIAPGIDCSVDALYAATARLPHIQVRRPDRVIGTNTVSAMESGVFWGYMGLIEGILARMEDAHGAAPTVVATGGLAPLFVDETPRIHHVDAMLTLDGLCQIHARNRATPAAGSKT